MTKFPFLAFEGLDGAGKTTLGQLFAKRQEFDYYSSIPPGLISLREQIAITKSPISTFHFYSLCNILRSYEYKTKVNNSGVVADRYVFSTLAYHSLLMKQDLSFYLHMLQSEAKFLLPDVIVYITASRPVINQRIVQRSQKAPMQWYGDRISLEYNLDESYKNVFNLFNIPIIQIDTTSLNPEEAYLDLCRNLYKVSETTPIIKSINFDVN